ncbi:PP2C family protein-serine/threonine phosphatase [Aliiroseovarius sp. 2305UL8-7]|uniref:PP2C family protein-serine/threonine phosphatase n=1 Tax=Aliiroseovarius conchicola TaxID=3121637 RepID=UPI00352989F8
MQTLDVSAEMIMGDRDHQEDCVAFSVNNSATSAFIVLADGMGGHKAGEIASALVVKHMLTYFKTHILDQELSDADIRVLLRHSVEQANTKLSRYQEKYPDTRGMGTTLIAALLQEDRLYWISVGDSLLLKFENGALERLNEDHSYAEILSRKVAVGEMDAHAAAVDPRRSQLTSAMIGRPIPKIDLNSYEIEADSTAAFVVASDGLLTCSDDRIVALSTEHATVSSAQFARALVQDVIAACAPNQDNTSVAVLRLGV